MVRHADESRDDFVGLDPYDPEVRAFAAHLERMEHPNAHPTVEGTLEGIGDFVQCANRTDGHRRVVVVTVVLLILLGVGFTLWSAIAFVLSTVFV
jgi:hypothetical protein